MQSTSSWLEYVSTLGSISTPFILIALTAVGWKYRHTLERRYGLEDKLRDARIGTYNDILEPFIILLTSDAAWKMDPKNKNQDKNQSAQKVMLSLAYRRHAFKLSLVGNDDVVKAYNDMMQFLFHRVDGESPDASTSYELMRLLGKFMLEIRKSMGNEATILDEWGMLEWFLEDARNLRTEYELIQKN